MTAGDYVESNAHEAEQLKDIDKKLKEYNKLMKEAAANLEFETAMVYRDKIKELENIYLKS